MHDLLCDEVQFKTRIHTELNTLKDVLVEKDAELAVKEAELAVKDAELAVKDAELALHAKLAVIAVKAGA